MHIDFMCKNHQNTSEKREERLKLANTSKMLKNHQNTWQREERLRNNI